MNTGVECTYNVDLDRVLIPGGIVRSDKTDSYDGESQSFVEANSGCRAKLGVTAVGICL